MKTIKKYLDFISENKKEIDEKSTPIEIDEKEIEKDEDSEKDED